MALGGWGVLGWAGPAVAQGATSGSTAREANMLPPVAIDAPQPAARRSAQRPAQPRARTARSPAASRAPQAPAPPAYVERANGPVRGYVATRSATGTKTDTPLVETPQSVSVVTREQIEAQAAKKPRRIAALYRRRGLGIPRRRVGQF